MVTITKRIAQILSLFVFFILMIVGIFSSESFELTQLPAILLKAFIGYVIFWLLGIILADILLKGILTSMEDKQYEEWEGGILMKFSRDKNEEIKRIQIDENEPLPPATQK